ncbi:MAG: U32 family peptidase [Promethearchaeota archaeon]|jgi:collagenase-like PrtC family protease
MQFTVATNWDFNLIEELTNYPVRDLYGVGNFSIVGHGRPSFLIKEISEEGIAEYIGAVHNNNMKFSYLLNAPCLSNMEYEPNFHQKLIEHLQWISDIGADYVIVTIPFLMQIIKEQFPNLKIRVSTISHVNSVNRAKFYESLGADEITPSIMINRDFKTLKKILKAVKCKIVPLLTDGCLYQCPFRHYHYNLLGHSSQGEHQLGGNYIDSCILNCSAIKFSNKEEVVKARWIRPEDLSHYEEIGIDTFKIAGRRMSTEWIIRAVKAFSSRKYEGNLVDIIQGFTMSIGIEKDPTSKFRQTVDTEPKSKLIIDNTKLDGFIDFFKTQDCISMCDECNYCTNWAEKAVFFDKEQAPKYVESIKDYLDDLVTSREFGIKTAKSKEEKENKFKWDAETAQVFGKLINLSPPQFQSIARVVISSLAEEKAKNRDATMVEKKDILKAFLEGTPEPFQPDMREGLKKYGLLKEEGK